MNDQGNDLPPDQWRRAKEVFGAALEREPADRAAFLDVVCGTENADVRREVEGLLAAHDASTSFLETPVVASLTPSHSGVVDGHTLGPYRVLRTLGRGGMATVYLARDERHRRSVALKVLHPDLAHALGSERFLREIEVAANLTHPHILPLHDSGEVEGLLYYVMPYIEGESLRDRLTRETQLPVEDALQIAREVADALAYSHGQGVIHRDIKPENILLYSGHALVADFGIARAIWQAADERLTKTGMSVGTVAYMSPEQTGGERQVDGRSDVYSLGCVVYEMLAGEPPYTGPTAQAIIAKRFSDPVPSVRRIRPAVSEGLDHAVTRALAPVAADRYPTAADFAGDLTNPAISAGGLPSAGHVRSTQGTSARSAHRLRAVGAAVALGLLAAAGLMFWQRSQEGTENGPTRLAVLPFENLGDLADAYFADGMTDAVRGKLSALPAFQVIARQSSMEYRQGRKSLKAIGRDLNVEYVVTGTVRWQKSPDVSRVQVSPELVQISTASTRWHQPFDAALTDVFQIQAEIAGRVAEALDVKLGDGEQGTLARRPTTSLAAYDAYLKGQSQWDVLGLEAAREAAAHFSEAVALDSTFVAAWAQLSTIYSNLYYNRTPAPEIAARARGAADRALAIDPESAEAHAALGRYFYFVTGDVARAAEAFATARRLAPGDPELLATASDAERSLGHWDRALELLQSAQELDPRSAGTSRRLGYTYLWLRRHREALEAFDRAIVLTPTSFFERQGKAMVFLAQGDLPAAQAVLRQASGVVEPATLVADMGSYWDLYWVLDAAQQDVLLRLTRASFGDDPAAQGTVFAGTLWQRGDRARARAYADSARVAIEAQLREAPEDGQRHVFLGLSLAYLGRAAEAVRAGERAVALRPLAKDAFAAPYLQHQLARIHIVLGQQEEALDQLEPLLKIPYYLSPAWLKIDPTFDPLRGNPRFQRLVNASQ
jgi:serine/threonine protein kinase/tetratricopeptide (TPR) repeat protein